MNGIDIYLPLGNMIDIEKEKARLKKQLEQTEGKMQGLEKRLSNKGFLQNAPEDVITKEKKALKELSEELQSIQQKIQELSELTS